MIPLSEKVRGQLLSVLFGPDILGAILPMGADYKIKVDGTEEPVRVKCADGTIVVIKPGKSKIFISRGDYLIHLLDCACEKCVESRKPKEEKDAS